MNDQPIKTTPVCELTVHEFKKQYDATTDLCFIDVRENHEWQMSHIPRATHIPKGDLAETISEYAPDRARPIYLHCQGGTRSLYAAETLAALGYQTVYSIKGGIREWAEAGYPIEQ